MNVILYMAVTVNGLIAKLNDNTDFTSPEDWLGYQAICEKTKAVIIGRRTYESTRDAKLFWKFCQYFVLTNNQNLTSSEANVEVVHGLPNDILRMITSRGYSEVCIAGGAKLNASFMEAGLIDELYLDIEPIIFGKGIPLFSPSNFEQKLKLLGTKILNASTIQLHYAVIK